MVGAIFDAVFKYCVPRCLFVPSFPHSSLGRQSPPAGTAQDVLQNSKDAGTSMKDLKKTKKAAPEARRSSPRRNGRNASRSFKNEVSKTYKNWLDQDVRYIITPEEEQAFKLLGTDEERDAVHRAVLAAPRSHARHPENEFREEHYRRIEYANEHFAAGIPGWMTDRGRMYIVWGPPDEIESHPAGGTYNRDAMRAAADFHLPLRALALSLPRGHWQRTSIIEFVDSCMCSDYHISMDPE